MSVTINGTNGLVFADASAQNTAPKYGMVNRIINGAMMIDQRNAGASVTPASGTYTYLVDRFKGYATAASKYTAQQNAGSVTPPVGFTNYLGATSSSAYSVTSSDTFFLAQVIEGFNIADLAWGTANAQTVTLSFLVRSSLTGTFGGSLRNVDTPNRSYPFSYTISSANTWTTISVTIAGDTTGTWNTTNGQGIQVQWNLGSGSTFSGTAGSWQAGNLIAPTGSVSVVGTSGATFYITGVQLEKGSTATSFDYRPYGTELLLCQRYCWVYRQGGSGSLLTFASAYSTTNVQGSRPLPVIMRAVPTLSFSGGFQVSDGSTTTNSSAVALTGSDSDATNLHFWVGGFSGLTQFRGYFGNMQTSGQTFTVSAEL